MSYIALLLKIITYPFFRIPKALFTMQVKSIGVLFFDCVIVSVICALMISLEFYQVLVMISMCFLIALLSGFAWRKLTKGQNNELPQLNYANIQTNTTVYKNKINTIPVSEKRSTKQTSPIKNISSLPDFDNMSGEELGKWILEHPEQVRVKPTK